MALFKRNKQLKDDPATGFGTHSNWVAGRFYRKDGRANVYKKGLNFLERYSWYHTMLEMPRWKFWIFLLMVFMVVNLIFASIYTLIGLNTMAGVEPGGFWKRFSEAFFFSAQTFTTVGYGRLNPTGFWSSLVASFEAFLGVLNFALATGLLFGRFSHPQAFLRFSDHALVTPFREGRALMFRVVPFKNNHLTEAEVKLTFGLRFLEEGRPVNKFYALDTDISRINALFLNWTIVHVINEKSPLYQLSQEELLTLKAELIVFVRAFDETFSNTVVARTSYTADEIRFGQRFLPMYQPSADGQHTLIDISLLNATESVELPPFPTPPLVGDNRAG